MGGGHLAHLKNDVRQSIGGLNSFEMEFIKELQKMRGPLELDYPITSKIDRYKI